MTPETRNSLILRLKDSADDEAWNTFVEIYRPVILRLALAKRLQKADAEDLAQKVLISVAGAIERWDPSGSAKFRTWLKRIIDNAVINALVRVKPDRATGNETTDWLGEQPDRDGPDSQLLQLEYRREVFQWAAKKIATEFSAETWQAFWMTSVESKPAEEVGRLLGKKRGSIYTARSRVMKRLVEVVNEFTELPE